MILFHASATSQGSYATEQVNFIKSSGRLVRAFSASCDAHFSVSFRDSRLSPGGIWLPSCAHSGPR